MRKGFSLLLILLLCKSSEANFVFNERCQDAYDKILSLRLQEGQALVNAEKKANPNNGITILLENYIDFLRLLTLETQAEFEKFKTNKSARLDLLEKEDKSSPYYLYCRAEINLQSCINRFKFQEFITGAYELQKAYKELEENQKKFPDFLPNQKSLGLLYSLIGMVPDQYKWALSTIGLKGDVKQGMEMLNHLRLQLPHSSYEEFLNETIFFLSFIQMTAENIPGMYENIMKNTAPIGNQNLLNVYIRSIVAIRTGHSDDAIEVLSTRPHTSAYAPFPYLDYLYGIAKLNHFDEDADDLFESYLKTYTGCFNIKDSYQRLAWYHLIHGNLEKYKTNLSLCKTKGSMYSEKDKDAYNQSLQTAIPDILLLRARLYFEGGYFDKALYTLRNKKQEDFTNERERLEYSYRMGRIYQELQKPETAIQYYTGTISKGMDATCYFAAGSSLQLAYVFENKKNYPQAKYYYNLCMKMKNQEYKNTIESKAKAGLKRIP